jgi:hypothetical protein
MSNPKISKIRYADFKNTLEKQELFSAEQVSVVLDTFCKTMKFDPEMKTSPEVIKKVQQYRERKREETGKSIYELFGHGKYYQNHKEEIKAKKTLKST